MPNQQSPAVDRLLIARKDPFSSNPALETRIRRTPQDYTIRRHPKPLVQRV